MDEKDRRGTVPPMQVGDTVGGGSLLAEAREWNAAASQESLSSRATRRAVRHANDAVRLERLANKLTPEVETAIWCLREAIALGLIDAGDFFGGGTRGEERARNY